MPQPNVPDITAPARRSLNASIGTVANYGTSLTGDGGGAVGGTNNSIGGTVYNGVDSSNNFPKNQSVLDKTNSGGASFSIVSSSANPPSVQQRVVDDAVYLDEREAVVPTTSSSVSTPATGELVNFPKSDVVISSQINGYYEIKEENILGNQNGIQQTSYLVDDLEKVAEDRAQVLENPNKKLDGADFPLGDPTDQDREGLPNDATTSSQLPN